MLLNRHYMNHKIKYPGLSVKQLLLLCVFSLLMATSSKGQLNLKTGYLLNYLDPQVNNQLFESFNTENDWLDNSFDNINWMHGMEVGMRYRMDFVAIEADWAINFADSEASGINPVDNSSFSTKYIYNYHKYSVGLENIFGPIGVGAKLSLNRIAIKSKVSGVGKSTVLRDNHFTGTIFLGLYTQNNGNISFGLRPFVQLPITQYKITALAEDLELPVNETPLEEDDFWIFGLSLLFLNGY